MYYSIADLTLSIMGYICNLASFPGPPRPAPARAWERGYMHSSILTTLLQTGLTDNVYVSASFI